MPTLSPTFYPNTPVGSLPRVLSGGLPSLRLHGKAAPVSPAPGMKQEVLDLLSGTESHAAQKEMQEVLSEYPESLLRNLAKHGLKIEVSSGKAPMPGAGGAVPMGAYNLLTRKISFDESVLFSDFGRHVVLHEVTHAIDHMQGDRTRLTSKIPVVRALPVFVGRGLGSAKNTELGELYRDYQARSTVEDAVAFKANLAFRTGFDLPQKVATLVDDGWGVRRADYEARGAKDVITFDNDPGFVKRKITGAVLGGIAAAVGTWAGMPMLVNAGLGFIGLQGALLAKDVAVRKFGKEDVRTVPMLGGESATVTQKGPFVRVEMPEQATARPLTWSPYAHRANMVAEYLAEGVSTWLESPQDRDRLHRQDPKMHAFVEGFIRDEFARP